MSLATSRRKSPHWSLIGGRKAFGETIFWSLCWCAASAVIVLAVVLTAYIFMEAWPAIERLGWRFLVRDHWIPPDDLGALPFIYGTLWTSTMAMLIAVPLGIATAAFLAEIAPSGLRRAGSFLIELLAAIPSVVYGFWAIKFLGPLTKNMFLVLARRRTSTATTCSRRASFWRS